MAFLTTFLPSPVTWASEGYKSSCWCCSNRNCCCGRPTDERFPSFIKQSKIFLKKVPTYRAPTWTSTLDHLEHLPCGCTSSNKKVRLWNELWTSSPVARTRSNRDHTQPASQLCIMGSLFLGVSLEFSLVLNMTNRIAVWEIRSKRHLANGWRECSHATCVAAYWLVPPTHHWRWTGVVWKEPKLQMWNRLYLTNWDLT